MQLPKSLFSSNKIYVKNNKSSYTSLFIENLIFINN